MRISRFLLSLGALLVCVAGISDSSCVSNSSCISNSSYSIADTYDYTNFFEEFSFFTGPDPTAGFVDYQAAGHANQSSLAGYSNGAVYLGVDYKTMNPAGGRKSVRVTSKKSYTKGLIIADIAHMPGGICGTWPAFWTFGPNWPKSGEIDILEGVNMQQANSVTLHTSKGCTFSSAGSLNSSKLVSADCNGNSGCSFDTANPLGYGATFNMAGGGVYAMEWTSSSIAVFFFPRGYIPTDITAGLPNPAGWGTPVARFSGNSCDIDSHFNSQQIVFNTVFCGEWAGKAWSNSTCAAKASTCDAYVNQNPSDFVEAYWLINYVKVYQNPRAAKRHFE